jgi:hypothetical protein
MKRVAIAGDIVIDWNLARARVTERSATLWDPDYRVRAYPPEVGGVALIKAILERSANQTYKVSLVGHYPSKKELFPENRRYSHSYTVCRRNEATFHRERDRKENALRKRLKPVEVVWQVESFLGLDKGKPDIEGDSGAEAQPADLILIDDGNAGFRDRFERDSWPTAVPKPAAGGWILLKWARPDFRPTNNAENWLWYQLQKQYSKQLIVVFTANDLRLTEMQISRELSWEQTAQDVMREIKDSESLQRCAAVVVSFYTSGAIVYWKGESRPLYKLYYDPSGVEAEWLVKHPGRMVGYTQCLVAAIAHSFMQQGVDARSLGYGIRAGLVASRDLHEQGFEADAAEPFPQKLSFPIDRIARTIRKNCGEQDATHSVFIEETIKDSPEWSLSFFADPNKLAGEIIFRGPGPALKAMSVCKFADLVTVDRAEAESLRSISALIAEYARNRSYARPMSIAVFGSPGSGKSFAVQQVMEALRKRPDLENELGRKEDHREFNLSQFRSSEDLLGALHQIRDVALSGRIPLVFWDEFDTQMDSRPLGWLRYFLAPMQDGKFQEEQVTHLTGRAVFVFAGGTNSSMKEFEDLAERDKNAKGRDFLSRLKGYINIPALDHAGDRRDPLVIIRRAILFRSMLERRSVPDLFRTDGDEKIVDVDQAVTYAFLNVKQYKHGARSMESIINMSLLDGKRLFEQSSLPSKHLLDLHVDSDEFIDLVRRPSV